MALFSIVPKELTALKWFKYKPEMALYARQVMFFFKCHCHLYIPMYLQCDLILKLFECFGYYSFCY